MPKYTVKQKAAMGRRIASVFNLSASHVPYPGADPRYSLGEGYLDKTALGVFEVFVDISKQIDAGRWPGLEQQKAK